MSLRSTMCPQAQTSQDQTKYLRGINISPPPTRGSKQQSPGRILGRWGAERHNSEKKQKRQSGRAVYKCLSSMERSGGSRSKGRGHTPALIRREGRVTDQLIRDHACEASVRATVCSAGFWERTERLIYVRGKEGRRTAAVVVSCCRLECTNTLFMTSSSFQSLSVSL